MSSLCIVVPCYNEETRLPADDFKKAFQELDFHFCFVNDGSSDNTLQVLQNLSAEYSDKVHVLDMQKNGGKAEAVRQGILHCLSMKKYDFVGFLDADLATPVLEMSNLMHYAVTNNKQMVTGLRLRRIGAQVIRRNMRLYVGRIMGTAISLMLKLPTYDTQCGAKIFHSQIAEKLFQEKFISKWLFDVEIFFRVKLIMKEKIFENVYEYPLFYWQEVGKSKIKATYLFKIPIELIKISRKYNSKKSKQLYQ